MLTLFTHTQIDISCRAFVTDARATFNFTKNAKKVNKIFEKISAKKLFQNNFMSVTFFLFRGNQIIKKRGRKSLFCHMFLFIDLL
jgi:hypothetical protein